MVELGFDNSFIIGYFGYFDQTYSSLSEAKLEKCKNLTPMTIVFSKWKANSNKFILCSPNFWKRIIFVNIVLKQENF